MNGSGLCFSACLVIALSVSEAAYGQGKKAGPRLDADFSQAPLAERRNLARAAPRQADVDILGPAPAPLSLLRGRFRHRLLLKCQRSVNASALARAWVDQVDYPNQVRVAIDVDPYSFL